MITAIKPSLDRKTKFRKTQKNTYGLLPGQDGTCPHATTGEGGCSHIPKGRKLPVCYVHGVMSAYTSVGGVLQHNTYIIQTAPHEDRVTLLKQEFERFRKTELKQKEPKLFYRLHWSGDLFNEEYAQALIEAMNAFPDIKFWNYTRSLHLGPVLADATPNLVQYLSLDPVNIEEGLQIWLDWLKSYPPHDNLTICYMAPVNDFKEKYAELSKNHSDWPEKLPVAVPCPADTKNIPLEGACALCMRCLRGRVVWFKS